MFVNKNASCVLLVEGLFSSGFCFRKLYNKGKISERISHAEYDISECIFNVEIIFRKHSNKMTYNITAFC